MDFRSSWKARKLESRQAEERSISLLLLMADDISFGEIIDFEYGVHKPVSG